MKEFLKVLRRFALPYKSYMIGAIFANLLSAVLNVFSFMSIMPMLNMLFGMDTTAYAYQEWQLDGIKDIAINNIYYYTTVLIGRFGHQTTLLLIGVFLAVTTFLKTSCYFLASAVMVPLRTGIVRDIRILVYDKVLHLPLAFVSEERRGDIIARMSGDVMEVETSITASLEMLIRHPILIIFYFATLVFVSWQLTLFVLLTIPALGWGMGALGRKLKAQSLTAQNKWSETMAQLDEMLGGLRIVKAFIAEDKMLARFRRVSNEYRNASNRVAVRQASAHPVSEFLGTCLIVLVLWFGGRMIAFGDMQTGELISFITYIGQILMSLMMLSMVFIMLVLSRTSIGRVVEVLDEKPEITSPEPISMIDADGKSVKGAFNRVPNGSIDFKDVSFSYHKDPSNCVLNDVNLHIESGQMVGIIGGTGASKSTLVSMIPRLYDVLSGTVSVGGIDVRKYDLKALRDGVAMVLQKNVLFSGTIKDNLRWGDENAGDAEIIEACRAADAYEFVSSFPDGFETDLGQGGVNLSGGQKQRLCIARALLKKPKILILDDSTSAVDTATDARIRSALRSSLPETTKIIIAQRINSVQDADVIFVMDNGRIDGVGTHEQLLESNAIYREVYESQQSKN